MYLQNSRRRVAQSFFFYKTFACFASVTPAKPRNKTHENFAPHYPVAKKNANYLGLLHTKKERPKSSRSFFTLFVIYAIIARRPLARLLLIKIKRRFK